MAAPLVTSVLTILYKITNLVNGECYIGITCRTLHARMAEHRSWRTDERHNGPLCRAMQKYGFDNFVGEILSEHAAYEEALAAEVRRIAEVRPYYNRSPGGDGVKGCWIGKKLRPETVEKIRAAKLANPSKYWLGKRRSADCIEKIRATKTGQPHKRMTDLENLTAAENMRRAAHARRRPIRCLVDGRPFESAVEAAREYGLDYRRIHLSIKRGKPYDGLRFQYEAT
jgi:group I intron endonuclease